MTRTLSLIVRPFGIHWPPATDEEAAAIAAPASRMIARAPMVQRIVRKIADPVVLTGAIVALFGARQVAAAGMGSPARPRPPVPADAPAAAARASASSSSSAPAPASVDAGPPIATGDFIAAAQLREQILNGIAHADIR